MAQIINGKIAYKIGLHMHSSRSDGHLSYEDVILEYKRNGYDAVAVTDHWKWNPSETLDDITIISGAEYNTGGADAGGDGVYHILAIGCKSNPDCNTTDTPQNIVDKIHDKDGIAVLAHPAWSLNSPECFKEIKGIDMTEIYNTVSGVHESDRPYSGSIIDIAASKGFIIPIHAADDSHYYDGTDSCVAYILAYASSNSVEDILHALRTGNFFSSMGPTIDIKKESDRSIRINTSPVSKIAVHSNLVWANKRILRGENITEKIYIPKEKESFVRIEATDSNGLTAWSNIVKL